MHFWRPISRFGGTVFTLMLVATVPVRAQASLGEAASASAARTVPPTTDAANESTPRRAISAFAHRLDHEGVVLPTDCHDDVGQHLLARYGAMFVARDVVVPTRCLFTNANELAAFTARVPTQSAHIGAVKVTLQPRALNALLFAVADARLNDARLSLRSSKPAQRDYDDSQEFWRSRLVAALSHWTRRGKLSRADAQVLRDAPPRETVLPIHTLEARGVYFGRGYRRSIFSSAAVPGASQHHALLAIDVTEYESAATRTILGRYGWYQTVAGDPAHFTFLGVAESELPTRGLQRVVQNGHAYWVPLVDERRP
jgi:hypothetical protein